MPLGCKMSKAIVKELTKGNRDKKEANRTSLFAYCMAYPSHSRMHLPTLWVGSIIIHYAAVIALSIDVCSFITLRKSQ